MADMQATDGHNTASAQGDTVATGSLDARLADAAGAEKLLVVSDFDGTLAGFSDDRMNVPVTANAMTALEKLATLPNTFVAILSGRALVELQALATLNAPVMLVGSHGAESSADGGAISNDQLALLDRIAAAWAPLLDANPGSFIEEKPYHRVLHTRKVADREAATRALDEADKLARAYDVHMTHGKNVLEAAVVDTNKGSWIDDAREQLGCDCVVFVGDDTTDEDGFKALGDYDLGIKVGPGETAAHVALPNDLEMVGDVLTRLAELRQRHG